MLRPQIGTYLDRLEDRRNKDYKSKHPVKAPDFDPAIPCALGEVLRTDPDPADPNSSDPYYGVAARITGVPVREVTKSVRDTFKTVTLGLVNSITPTGLARQLGYGDDTAAVLKAKGHMEQFLGYLPPGATLYGDLVVARSDHGPDHDLGGPYPECVRPTGGW